MGLVIRDNHIINKIYNSFILEDKRVAKTYLDTGKITPEEYDTLINLVPTKYVGWISKRYITGEMKDFDTLRNTVEEFDAFVRSGKIKGSESNIQIYKTFDQLQEIVNKFNQTPKQPTKKELKGDFEVVVDNEDLRIVVPYTYEASRQLGITPMEEGGFAFRDCEGGGKDSAWCTTYVNTSEHWDKYYYKNNVDFFYILIKSDQLKSRLQQAGFKPEAYLMALARANINEYKGIENKLKDAFITQNNEGEQIVYDAYDGKDHQLKKAQLEQWMSIVGVS